MSMMIYGGFIHDNVDVWNDNGGCFSW